MTRRLGLAIGARTLWAVRLGRSGRSQSGHSMSFADLRSALAELRERVGPGPYRVSAALLPDVAQFRALDLPPLGADDARAVLERAVHRYFPTGGVQQALGVGRAGARTLASTAPHDVVAALEHAVREVGWRLGRVVPAEAAWAAATAQHDPEARHVLVALPDRLGLLELQQGALVSVRRLPAALVSPPAIAGLMREARAGPDIRVIGKAHSVEGGGMRLTPVGDGEATPEELAATHAARAWGPEILTDGRWTARGRATRALAMRLAGLAAALVMLAGATEWWGVRRELAALSLQRAQHARLVADAVALRERVTALGERYDVLRDARTAGARWSHHVSDIATHLPRTAYLTAFRASADSLELAGVARESAGVFDALRAAPGVVALRATAPVRREGGADGEVTERFAFSARVAPNSGARQ